jgi:hypothetical protein
VEFYIPRTYMEDVISKDEEDYLHIITTTATPTTTSTTIVCDHEWVTHITPVQHYCVPSKP